MNQIIQDLQGYHRMLLCISIRRNCKLVVYAKNKKNYSDKLSRYSIISTSTLFLVETFSHQVHHKFA